MKIYESSLNVFMNYSWMFLNNINETFMKFMNCQPSCMNGHKRQYFIKQMINEHSWTFIKCVHELFTNVPEQ